MNGSDPVVHSRKALQLKLASEGLVEAVCGQDAAAETIVEAEPWRERPVRQQHISDCKNGRKREFLTIHQAASLEDASAGKPGWPHVTRAMAKRQGFALLPLPERIVGDSNLHRALAQVVQETGDVSNKVLTALADLTVDAAEIKRLGIPQEIEEAIAAFANLKSLVDAIVGGGES